MDDEVAHLKELILTILAERDQRYEDRHIATQEAVAQAFKSAEKAGDKTESALSEYKTGSNEWRGTLNDIVSKTMLRADYDREHKHLEERLAAEVKRIDQNCATLSATITKLDGEKTGRLSTQELFLKNLPALIVSLIVIVSAVVGVAYAVRSH